MTGYQRANASFYKGWDGHQQRLAEAIVSLTREQLTLSLPHHWAVGKIAAHIIAACVWWFHTQMGKGSTELATLEFWDNKEQPLRSAAELVDGLERTGKMIWDALER